MREFLVVAITRNWARLRPGVLNCPHTEERYPPKCSWVLTLQRNASKWALTSSSQEVVLLNRLSLKLFLPSSSKFTKFPFSRSRETSLELELRSRMNCSSFLFQTFLKLYQDSTGFFFSFYNYVAMKYYKTSSFSVVFVFRVESTDSRLFFIFFFPKGKDHGMLFPSELALKCPFKCFFVSWSLLLTVCTRELSPRFSGCMGDWKVGYKSAIRHSCSVSSSLTPILSYSTKVGKLFSLTSDQCFPVWGSKAQNRGNKSCQICSHPPLAAPWENFCCR